jgi:hypothetical protein
VLLVFWLRAGSWKLEAGSWKLEAGSWKLEANQSANWLCRVKHPMMVAKAGSHSLCFKLQAFGFQPASQPI